MNISGGIKRGPVRVLIYGPEGIGKTQFASKFPKPLFIDTENGSMQIDVQRFDRPTTWDELIQMVQYVLANPTICDTLVIDTLDWAEKLATDDVLAKGPRDKNGHPLWSSIESPGYGKGYVYLADRFVVLTQYLDQVVQAGINVCMTAHAKMRKFEQPDESGAYDRWEMKLTRNVAPVVKEWSDMILFCNYKTYVQKIEVGKDKAHGGERVAYSNHAPTWDAKNRFGLPDIFPLDYANIAHVIPARPEPPKPGELVGYLRENMAHDGITEQEIQAIVARHDPAMTGVPIDQYNDALISGWIQPNWDRCVEFIMAGRNAGQGGI